MKLSLQNLPKSNRIKNILSNTYILLCKPYNAKLIPEAVQDFRGDWCIPWNTIVSYIQKENPQIEEHELVTAFFELEREGCISKPGE